MSEIVVYRHDDGALPQRRRRGTAEPLDTRLLRTIAAALPAAFPPVSQLGVEIHPMTWWALGVFNAGVVARQSRRHLA